MEMNQHWVHPEFCGLEPDASQDIGPLVNQRDALRRLRGTLRISEKVRLRYRDLKPAERKLELDKLKVKRALRVLREERLVSLTMLADLEQATNREVMLQLRRILSGGPTQSSMGRKQPARHAGPPGRSPDPGSHIPNVTDTEPSGTDRDG